MNEAKVTVVLPTRNRADCLTETLGSYLSQNGVGEIIVVDDGGSDHTQQCLNEIRKHAAKPLIYLRHAKRRGAAEAKNTGVTNARYPLTLFGEDDVFLAPDYVQCLRRKLVELDADIIAGQIIYMWGNETQAASLARWQRELQGDKPVVDKTWLRFNFDVRVDTDVSVPFVHAIVLTKTALAQTVGFRGVYPVNGFREETDYQLSVLKRGGSVYLTPATQCYHMALARGAHGGQRDVSWGWYEFWAFVNNWTFLCRHWTTLRRFCGSIDNPFVMQWRFLRGRWKTDIQHRWRETCNRGRQRMASHVDEGKWRLRFIVMRSAGMVMPTVVKDWVRRHLMRRG
jgi:glycosyltransferase involved in cell wall biosynthesis